MKAITGGVIALKGQIIKVKGHLVSAKGALLQTKGEAISNFGRHIATKALLTPAHVPASGTGFGHTSTALGKETVLYACVVYRMKQNWGRGDFYYKRDYFILNLRASGGRTRYVEGSHGLFT